MFAQYNQLTKMIITMKRMYLFFMLLAAGWWSNMAAEDYLMPQYGHETKVVSKNAPLTFYDFKGASTHFTQSAFSTVIFQTASMPSSGYSTHSMLLMLLCERTAATPPMVPR